MDARSEVVRPGESYEARPARDRLPTLPEDLSEYAWIHTGPPSWSGERLPEAYLGARDAPVNEQSAFDEISTGHLVDLWHSDIPKVIATAPVTVDEREVHILSLMDGRTTIGTLLETSPLSMPDVLGTLCELCARGLVRLDRSHRVRR